MITVTFPLHMRERARDHGTQGARGPAAAVAVDGRPGLGVRRPPLSAAGPGRRLREDARAPAPSRPPSGRSRARRALRASVRPRANPDPSKVMARTYMETGAARLDTPPPDAGHRASQAAPSARKDRAAAARTGSP